MVEIVQKDAEVLHKKSEEVKLTDIGSPKLRKIISDMSKALASQADGVAIAAPQIGVPLRIFVVSGSVFSVLRDEEMPKKMSEGKEKLPKAKDLVFINPVITRLSREKIWMEEGCLSVRWQYGLVERSKKAKVRAINEHGVPFEMGGSGILAEIFQHETDHLDGILFIEKATDLQEIPPEKHEGHTPRLKNEQG